MIDSSTNKVVQTIDLPGQPNQMVYDPDSQEIYISCGTASSRTGFVVPLEVMQTVGFDKQEIGIWGGLLRCGLFAIASPV